MGGSLLGGAGTVKSTPILYPLCLTKGGGEPKYRRSHAMGIPLSEAAKKAIDANNFAHVATLMQDGSPQVSPVWIYSDGDDVLISTDVNRIKTRNLKRDPRVAISIAPRDAPFPPILI